MSDDSNQLDPVDLSNHITMEDGDADENAASHVHLLIWMLNRK